MIQVDDLFAIAREEDLSIELTIKPGDHLLKGRQVARIWGTKELDDEISQRIISAFLLGGERTPAQDIRYQFQQLTDVVLRALSPGINDPFTAINGIDELATGMTLLSERARVADRRQDDKGVLPVDSPHAKRRRSFGRDVGHIAISPRETGL